VKSKAEKEGTLAPSAPKGSVLGVIPPISVLIVEDNIINAQILEAFFRKRKLKYATAVNGKQAVEKWRQGGWHLVLVPPQKNRASAFHPH
jgi:osomolarity two-component system, response regulator SSK1